MEHAVAEEQRQAILSGHLSRTIQSWPGRGIMWYEGYIKCLVENSVLDKANLDEDYEQYLVHTLVDQASREISAGHQSLWEISMATVELLPATESSVQALERVRYEGDGLNTTEPCAVCLDEMLLGTQPTSVGTVVPRMPIKPYTVLSLRPLQQCYHQHLPTTSRHPLSNSDPPATTLASLSSPDLLAGGGESATIPQQLAYLNRPSDVTHSASSPLPGLPPTPSTAAAQSTHTLHLCRYNGSAKSITVYVDLIMSSCFDNSKVGDKDIYGRIDEKEIALRFNIFLSMQINALSPQNVHPDLSSEVINKGAYKSYEAGVYRCATEVKEGVRAQTIRWSERGEQVDNFFWHLERYFEALDIDDKEEKVQTAVMYLTDTAALWWRCRYTNGCDVNTGEKFRHELKRKLYPESIEDMAMINLRRLRQKGSI
ncbi:hypothetical protein RJ639_043669 [Escallonia herrerae]|uniref:Retrotransposon gag domain-containing protein n=1 Tax=Escallonia herrerae TaxID=1293975 RepID=A0AA89AZM5_9ASTE|nr:hypothetical protein RJ639_043669 [Escallonia herrerae]